MEIKKLNQKEIEALSIEERKNYYKKLIDSLKLEQKNIDRKLAEKRKVEDYQRRKKINHAKYILAGELLHSSISFDFLFKLSQNTRFAKRDCDDLNILLDDLGYSSKFQFKQLLTKNTDEQNPSNE